MKLIDKKRLHNFFVSKEYSRMTCLTIFFLQFALNLVFMTKYAVAESFIFAV